MIRRSAEHLSGLIDGLLDISKIEAGRLQIERNEVRLLDLLEQVEGMFRLQARAKSLQFRFEPATNLPAAVWTDEKRLRQILINLLSNAIKFTQAGHVALRVAYRNGVGTLVVEDSGPGIAAEDLARIFAPCDRGGAAERATVPGLGLGLTITKLLTQLMGGEITVDSAPGQGSRFRVRLLLSAVSSPTVQPARRIGGYLGRRRTVLVADDDQDHQALIREALTPLGFTVLTVRDAATCLALIADVRPDLFLLDVSMPGQSGWALLRQLRGGPHARTPVIMVSANWADLDPARPDDGTRPDAVVPKPVDLRRLLDAIERCLGLAWTAQPEEPERLGRALPSPAPPPAAGSVADILALARIGYVRGIEAKLAELGRDPDQAALVGRLRVRLDSFDLEGLISDLSEAADG